MKTLVYNGPRDGSVATVPDPKIEKPTDALVKIATTQHLLLLGPAHVPCTCTRAAPAIPVDDSKGSPVDKVMELTGGGGADRDCECVGWQAHTGS